jgi:hypothetical protein
MSYANSPAFDTQSENEFKQLDKIENYLKTNPGSTLEELKIQNQDLLAGIEIAEESAIVSSAKGDLPGGIPPFLWGCVLGVIGILLVYIMSDNDKDLTKKAVIGCLVGWGSWIVIWLLFSFGVLGAAASTAI